MRLLLALQDVKTARFMAPVAVMTLGEAERWYQEVLETPGTVVSKHPRDFPLYLIGTYDDEQGQVDCNRSDAGERQVPRLLFTSDQFGKEAP